MESTDKRLLDQVRACPEPAEGTPSAARAVAGQCKHYSIRAGQAYVAWIKRYIFFHGVRHRAEMGAAEVEAFLTHLAVAWPAGVVPSSQSRARFPLTPIAQMCYNGVGIQPDIWTTLPVGPPGIHTSAASRAKRLAVARKKAQRCHCDRA